MYMNKWKLSSILLALCLTLTALPVRAASRNACTVQPLRNGQFVTQTAGTSGTIAIYVNGKYATTIARLNQPWYATADKQARVRGYDQDGLVC